MSHSFAPFANLSGIETAPARTINIAGPERLVSVFAGVVLATYGFSRRDLSGAIMAAVGGAIAYRGASGKCACYRQLGIDGSGDSDGRGVPGNEGIRIEASVEVAHSPMILYHFWHELSNLPEIMPHVKSVTVDGARSHWTVSGPAGRDVEWDAEFINEIPGELIAWQSLPGADVKNAGSVHFKSINDGESTLLKVALQYLPPVGKVGAAVAHLFGEAPDQQLKADLNHFKAKMEMSELRDREQTS